MKSKVGRVAKWIAVMSVLVAALSALSLVANHVEVSLSLPGDPPTAGAGSTESTHIQIGFRDARLYASIVQWKRTWLVQPQMTLGSPPAGRARFDWILRIDDIADPWYDRNGIEVNGWVLACVLAAYPLVVLLRFLVRTRILRRAAACTTCGYDLTGNVTGVCPECGVGRAGCGSPSTGEPS